MPYIHPETRVVIIEMTFDLTASFSLFDSA